MENGKSIISIWAFGLAEIKRQTYHEYEENYLRKWKKIKTLVSFQSNLWNTIEYYVKIFITMTKDIKTTFLEKEEKATLLQELNH